MKPGVIKVVIVESSPGRCRFLAGLFSTQPGLEVAGSAGSCDEALDVIAKLRPDVVTMGHKPPALDGLEATRRIMERCPVPIVIVRDTGSAGEVASTFDAVNAGALAVMPRPAENDADQAPVRELVQTVRLMSEVKVIRRWPRRAQAAGPQLPAPLPSHERRPGLRIVAIGASTGGPLALATLLGGLPRDFPAPVVVVQHMAAGFTRGFVDWLAPSSALPVHVATDGERLYPGHVYMAPDDTHMKVTRDDRVALVDTLPENGLRPSVACLFRSVAQVYGGDAAGVLLTGMGKDGAAELRLLKDHGAMTFAQDEESSIVHGMPGEAIRLEAAMHVLPPDRIAAALKKAVGRR